MVILLANDTNSSPTPRLRRRQPPPRRIPSQRATVYLARGKRIPRVCREVYGPGKRPSSHLHAPRASSRTAILSLTTINKPLSVAQAALGKKKETRFCSCEPDGRPGQQSIQGDFAGQTASLDTRIRTLTQFRAVRQIIFIVANGVSYQQFQLWSKTMKGRPTGIPYPNRLQRKRFGYADV